MAETRQLHDEALYPSVDAPDFLADQPQITAVVNNVSIYHLGDVTEKLQLTKAWRKKVREILQNHQDKILVFFIKPMPSEHPLKVAHTLLTKYGKFISSNGDLFKNPPQLFKDFVVDISGSGIQSLNVYLADLEKARAADQPMTRWMSMTRHMLEHMRDVGDELIRIDSKLQSECALLDAVVEKVTCLSNLGNPGVEGFEDLMETYIEKQFENHPIEALYWEYVHTIQKYSGLRDILMPQRTSTQAEPICCICMVEAAITAFVPCGHIFCMNCSKKTTMCHVCRQLVSSKMRLFFS